MSRDNPNKFNINLRFNILIVLIYIIGMILIVTLFNLQIVNGEEYREQSNTRLTRETTLYASRGNIYYSSGELLLGTKAQNDLEMYKINIENKELNDSILNIINVLEKNSCTYVDAFPININPFEYEISGDTLSKWKTENKFSQDITAEEAFYEFKDKYKISNESIEETRKIISIRYQITIEGYSSTKPIKIATNITDGAKAELSENTGNFAGINIYSVPYREYISGEVASHIIGYAAKISSEEYEVRKDTYSQNDIIGKTGIEYAFEEYLKGENGIKQIDMDVDGTITGEYIYKEAVAGSDIVLTIDSRLQNVTEQALASNIAKISNGGFGTAYEADAGACVVMDVDTGDVLAMASYPNYNPEDFINPNGISQTNWDKYINDEAKPLMNKATQLSYSPGSTFKMITGIAALESGVVTLDERINDLGQYKKYGITMNCWVFTDYGVGHGWVNIREAIEKSCNYYFYEVADRMGIDQLAKYANYFGLGGKTGIELPSESSGVLASKETKAELHSESPSWNPGDTLNAAIGQGDNEFTPVQMAQYISILANGGNPINVSIVETIRNSDGTEVPESEIESYINGKLGIEPIIQENLDINQEYIDAVLEGMESVTSDSGGTAYVRFKDFGISVGGKTGSAEAPNGEVHGWFVGFAPFENPEIAIVVTVENGNKGNYTAEVVVDIMEEYFGMNIDDINESLNATPYIQMVE